MERKINSRVIALIILAVITTTLGVTFVYYNIFQQQVRDDLRNPSEVLVDSGYFEEVYKTSNYKKLDNRFNNLSERGLRITWVDKDGTVLYDSQEDASKLSNHKDRPEIKEAFKNGKGESVRTSDTLKMNTFYYAVRIHNGTVVRVSTEAVSIINVFTSALPMVFLILLVEFLIGLWMSNHLTKQIVHPIEEMAEHLNDMTIKPPYSELEPFTDKIREQHDNILSAAKMRQDFSANVSHELKTPLTAISGYAELMENEMVDIKDYPRFATQIKNNAMDLLEMINDIITLSRFDNEESNFEMTPVDMKEVVEDAIESLEMSAAKRDVAVHSELYPAIVTGNKHMLEELAVNIIYNALKYNNPGGYVNVYLKNEAGSVVFEVTDNGIGISKADQKRIFERFYRAEKSRARSRGGSGIGLSIVKHVIEIHDAKIEVKSELGKGSTFRVTF